MKLYRDRPRLFAREVLGSAWWRRQEQVARAVAVERRVAVKSANGVGKTYLAADLALWFLYAHYPSVVLTTAPTWRQVRFVLWEEIRHRWRQARLPLPGRLLQTRITAGPAWMALGLATDEPARFQGFHAQSMLIIFDEASGIPDAIWDAAEGCAVGVNNKILAIGNPLTTTGRFYRVFREASAWRKLTISAVEHPNITGVGPPIPGAVTRPFLLDRIADWCEPTDRVPLCAEHDPPTGASTINHQPSTNTAAPNTSTDMDTFLWEGRAYRPNNLFRARLLGQFPTADDETLIPLRWIEAARMDGGIESQAAQGVRRVAADIARFGDDSTVIGLRVGHVLVRMDVIHGVDLMQAAGRIRRLAADERAESIAVDSIGMGAGVVDRLMEMEVQGIEAVNVGLPANDPERFANRRAELYWGLRERFRLGDVRIPPDDRLAQELAGIKYRITSRGQIQIESKDEMKRRGQASPDRADMLALLFDSSGDWLQTWNPEPSRPTPAAHLRAEMSNW